MAALGLCCCTKPCSNCGEPEVHFIAVNGLLTAVVSPVAEQGSRVHRL